MTNKLTKNLIPLAILVSAIIIGGVLIYTNPSFLKGKKENVLTSQEVGEKAVNYLNENFLKDQATAVLINVAEENGMYKLTIAIEGQEVGGELLASSVAEALRQVDALVSTLQAMVEAPLPDAHRQAECAAM